MRRYQTIAKAAALLAIALTAASCTGSNQSLHTLAQIPPDYRDRHPIQLVRATQAIPVEVSTHNPGISGIQRAQIESFVRSYRGDGDGTMLISVPSGSRNETAAVQDANEVKAIMVAQGLSVTSIAIKPYRSDPSVLAPPIELSYSRTRAAVPHPCRQNGNLDENIFNQSYENFGCAYQANLAAIIATPSDLTTPRAFDRPSAVRRYDVLEKYRTGSDTTTKSGKDTAGTVSKVGQ